MVAAPLLLAILLACVPTTEAGGKGMGINPARAGVALPGAPYRYVTLNPRRGERIGTVAMRVERESGRIDRWLRLRGQYYVPAVAYDMRGGGLSGDGSTLVLQRFTPAYPPRRSRFAVLDTGAFQRYPSQPGEGRPVGAVRRIEIPGFYSLHAVSSDGRTAYLNRHLPRRRSIFGFELRALDLESGRLLPKDLGPTGTMEGAPITQVTSPDGRRAYTLYDGNAYEGGTPFLVALDTVGGRLTRVDLPQLRYRRMQFMVRMRLAVSGARLAVFSHKPTHGGGPTPPLLSIDTRTFEVSDARTALMALGQGLVRSFADFIAPREDPLLAFARTPRRPGNLLARIGVVGHYEGRPVTLRQYGDPSWSGELLVFGANEIQPVTNGCPDPSADIYLMPDLPPEAPLARRVIRALDPARTIWLDEEANDRASTRSRLSKALLRMGRWVRED